MRKHLLPASAVLLLSLLVASCENDGGLSARAQEKSATYSSLKMWQKTLIDAGTISQGFTPDMVYIAMGRPTKIDAKDLPEGHAEMWTYSQYYPNVDAIHGFHHAEFTTESAYQPQRALTIKQTNGFEGLGNRPGIPVGQNRGAEQSIGMTDKAQGGTMEPANLRSYTIKVLFASGKVVQIGADENIN